MSNLDMYFGTKGYMQWVPCPLVDSDMSAIGWQSQSQYLNGGARVRRSNTAHKEYNLAWGLQSRDNIRLITDYADGVYGDGLIYFIDPFAMDKNILPSYWATPVLGAYDAPLLTGTVRPEAGITSSNSFMYPSAYAIYTVSSNDDALLYIPIPDGYVLWMGAKGTATGSAFVNVKGDLVAGGTSSTTLTLSSELDNVRVSDSWSSATYTGVNVGLRGSGGVLSLISMCAQILPIGATPLTGNFVSGQGNSGCSFAEYPKLQNYSSAMDKVGLTARLVEVGAWL